MANIIIIESDPKIARDMRTYVKEIDDSHRVRTFKDTSEFEQLYFAQPGSSKEPEGTEHLVSFSLPQLEWLNQKPLHAESPFGGGTCNFTVSSDNWQVDSVEAEPASFFGLKLAEVQADSSPLWGLIPTPFSELWGRFKSEIKESDRANTTIPFESADGLRWLIKVVGQTSPLEGSEKNTSPKVELSFTLLPANIEPAIEAALKEKQQQSDEEDEFQLLSTIELLIFNVDNIEGVLSQWVTKLRQALQDRSYFPEENVTRLVASKWEDDGLEKSKVVHPFIEDLIYLPLDRLLFLQKLEIILGLPGNTTPRFLFMQDVEMDIEVSKLSRIERMSDVAIAIRNPVPLSRGVLGHFYLKFPDQDEYIDFYAKSIRSEKHPKFENQHLVYFSYFGIDKATQTAIRRYLLNTSSYKNLIDQDPVNFEFNPDNIFTSEEEKRRKTVAVIDVNQESTKSIVESLKADIGQVRVIAETSYTRFLSNYVASAAELRENPPVPIKEDDLFQESISWVVNEKNELVSVESETDTPDTSLILGFPFSELFTNPKEWQQPFKCLGSEETLLEYMSAAKKNGGKPIEATIELKSKFGFFKIALITVSALEADSDNDSSTFTIRISAPKQEGPASLFDKDLIDTLDMIIIDAALIPHDVDPWVMGLNKMLKDAGLLKIPQVNIVVLSREGTPNSRKILQQSKVESLQQKPIDRRSLLFTISEALESPFTLYTWSNIGWADTILPTYIAKEAKLEKISEFGCALRQPHPIAPGTTLYLHGEIFDNAPDGSLCSRFYFCEEHPSEAEQYQCSVQYFGINDHFLKFTRSWIRENYALSKQSSD